jgi:Transposase IS200 like
MGVQVPRRVYAEVPQEAAVRENKAAVRSGVSRSGAAEGVPDRGRPSDAGSCSYVDIAQNVERKMRNFLGHKFWARGYFVTTVGRDEKMIRAYIRNQELADRQLDQFELKISAAPNPINRPNIP